MKKKDLLAILVVIIVSAVFAFIICSKFIFTKKDSQQTIEVVTPITATFTLPDKKIFNTEAFNPTKLIEIGLSSNNQPFANQ